LFYEVKANLKYEQLVTMRAGGLTAIQPGIESFSTEVLDLMDKGCKGYQNIQLLRWCEELGIVVAWNILYGFPGESAAEYEAMADLLPLLVHVQPPASCSPFRLDRFSPFYTRSEALGVKNIRPAAAYYYVFPFGRRDLARLAYYFDFDFIDGRDPGEYTRRLSYETARWWTHRTGDPDNPPRLDAEQTGDAVVITDTRPCAVQHTHRLEGLAAALYVLCDTAHTFASLSRMLSGYAEEAIATALEDLMDRKLLVKSDNRYLSLAILRNRSSRTTGEVHVSLSLEKAALA
jgi:ribosomal peptide maturation radical SAM protein 1